MVAAMSTIQAITIIDMLTYLICHDTLAVVQFRYFLFVYWSRFLRVITSIIIGIDVKYLSERYSMLGLFQHRKRSRQLATVVMFSLVGGILAGCGAPSTNTLSQATSISIPTTPPSQSAPDATAVATSTSAAAAIETPTTAVISEATTTAAESATAVTFPLQLTDATSQQVTFASPPKIGCIWYGCMEALADLGVPVYAAAMSQEDTTSVFLSPAGPPTHLIADESNPELWTAAGVDTLITRVPPSPDDDALKQAAPFFYLHHPSYGESSQTGYQAYIEDLRLMGQLTDKPEAAAQAVARFDTALQTLRGLATPETKNISVAVLFQGDGYQMVGPGNPFCVVLADVGLGRCVGEGGAYQEISAEAFLGINPDWIIYQSGDASYKDRKDPVWPQLKAVTAGQVYDAQGNRYYCCSLRGLIHALQEYVHYVLPEAGIPAPGKLDIFDPTKSPLVTPR